MTKIIELLIYEGLPEISRFLEEFEAKVYEPRCLLALGEALKATLACWWEVHKETIHEWEQCRWLIIAHFSDMEVYHIRRNDGHNIPGNHLREC